MYISARARSCIRVSRLVLRYFKFKYHKFWRAEIMYDNLTTFCIWNKNHIENVCELGAWLSDPCCINVLRGMAALIPFQKRAGGACLRLEHV